MKKTSYIVIFLYLILFITNNIFSAWPMFMGNHYLTGNNDEIVPEKKHLNWHFQAPSYLFYPVPYQDLVFVGCMDKHLYAIHKITGEVKWKCRLDYPPMKSSVTYKNYILITAGDYIFCIDIHKGQIIWSRKEGISVQLSTPIVINGIVYYGSRKYFYARYINNGHEIWKNQQVKIYGGTPIYWNKRIYFISKKYQQNQLANQSQLFCLNTDNGQLVWKQNIQSDPNIFTPVVYDEKVYIGSSDQLFAFNAHNGKQIWIKQFDHHVASHTVFANDRLYISLDNQKILMLNPKNGKTIDKLYNYNQKGASFIIIGETLFIPNRKGELYSVNSYTKKKLWHFQSAYTNLQGTLSSADGRVYMAIGHKLYSVAPGILPPAETYIAQNPKTPQPTEIPQPTKPVKPPPKIETEEFKIKMTDENKKPLSGQVVINQENKTTPYNTINGETTIKVEKNKEFTITAKAKDFFIKTVKIKAKQKKKTIDISLKKIQDKTSYVFQDIGFKYNSAELTSSSIPTLKAIAQLLKENSNLKIEIRGHTDNVGNDQFNLKLSKRRADKVKEYLVKSGITDTKVKTKGYGESKPVDSNKTAEGRAKNRRVEFFILKK